MTVLELSELARSNGEWLRGTGPEADIVISSRIRLARNLADFPFISRATPADRTELDRCLRDKLLKCFYDYRFPDEMKLPDRLRVVQEKAAAGDPVALRVFETIGVYLGYTIAHYADFYAFAHVLILGRVTSGAGGEQIMRTAREVFGREFPELAARITLHVPDEKMRRLGQAVAAASLPEIGK